MRYLGLLTGLAFASAVLAGCGGSPATDSGTTTAPGETQPGSQAPMQFLDWRLGESWTHHWYIGKNNTDELLVTVVVAEERTGGWLLAPANATHAAMHGAFVFPTLGVFGLSDISADVGDNHWPWYRFPLQNGTWTDTLVSRDGAGQSYTYPVTTTVTPRPGTVGAFDLEMRTAGKLVAQYDWSPTMRWFTEFRAYDAAKDASAEDWQLRIVSEGHNLGYQGPFFEDTGDVLLIYENIQTPGSTPTPSATFTMTADQNRLFMIRVTFAAVGAQETTILDPNMDPATKTVYHQEAYGPESGAVSIDLFDGIPGTWQVVGTGAGVATGSIVYAYGIHERAGAV